MIKPPYIVIFIIKSNKPKSQANNFFIKNVCKLSKNCILVHLLNNATQILYDKNLNFIPGNSFFT